MNPTSGQRPPGLLARLEGLALSARLLLVAATIALVGAIDVATGYELSFSLFYVAPVALAAWTIGGRTGVFASVASGIVWLVADSLTGHPYSHPLIPIWNSLIRLSFFVVIALLLAALRELLEREKALVRRDHLTGAYSARAFFELLDLELARQRRRPRPLTLVYVDLDHFKQVNDTWGHPIGDLVLQRVVARAQRRLRTTDILGRLGGDEFALLLPETDATTAATLLTDLRGELLEEMRAGGWPVTFSVGVVTSEVAPDSAAALVKRVDDLMYEVKRGGRDAIRSLVLPA